MNQGHLPSQWETLILEDVVEVYDSRRVPLSEKERQKIQGRYPYCGANGILDYINDFLFDGEYILLAEDGGYWGAFQSSAYLMEGKFWVNNHAHVLRAKERLADNLFLVDMLNYMNLDVFIMGTTRGKLNQGVMNSIPLTLPPLSEQRAIARALRAVQEARQARRREAALERERKAALMDYLFTHGTHGEPRQQTDVGEIPQSWQAVRLGEISKVRYGLGQPPQLDDNGIPMIRATDIKKGQIISDNVLKVKKEAIPKSRSPFLKKGDILVVRSGAYTGDVAMYDGRWEKAIAGYDLVASPNEEVNAVFLAQYLLGDRAQRFFKSQRDRSAQPHLNSEQLGNTLVPLPPNSEQGDIAATLITCDAKVAALEQEAALLEELFRAMLEELMTGRLSALPLVEVTT